VQQVRGDVHARLDRAGKEGLADHVAVRVLVYQPANFLQEWEHLRLGAVVYVFKAVVWTQVNTSLAGVVAQFPVLKVSVEDVQPEAVHAAFKPGAEHVKDSLAHLRVAEVQVGLLWAKSVVIVLVQVAVIFPTRTAEDSQPIVWVIPVRRRVAPDVPVVEGVIF